MKMPNGIKYITATYESYSDFDVEGVNWEDVLDYYIDNEELVIDYKNGEIKTLYSTHNNNFGIKEPNKVTFYNHNSEVVK